jgi:hypothetical protein
VRDLAKLLSVGVDHQLQSKINEVVNLEENDKKMFKSGNLPSAKKSVDLDIEFLNSHASIVSAICKAS